MSKQTAPLDRQTPNLLNVSLRKAAQEGPLSTAAAQSGNRL